MKNIHLIPTYKPSRLHFDEVLFSSPNFQISKTINSDVEGRNLYITSDEEIKEGDWCLDKFNQRWKLEDKKLIAFDSKGMKRFSTDNIAGHECKKIILTTDGDLIKDCVQAINDEFLEWFFQNPSCEEVKVIKTFEDYTIVGGKSDEIYYKIIIPKEEQKQHLINMMKADEELELYEEPKKETIEEAAERLSIGIREEDYKDGFIEGAKWQQERMYSEEDIKKAFKVGFSIGYGSDTYATEEKDKTCEEWFEKIKKK